jgi:hypothetical protein
MLGLQQASGVYRVAKRPDLSLDLTQLILMIDAD